MALREVVGVGCRSCEHPGRLYVATAARGCGEVAELAAARKCQKYADIPPAYTFLPIAMETLGSMNDYAYHFLRRLGRKISEVSGDSREGSFIYQRLSVTIQRSNAALFHKSFTRHDDPDL